MTLALLLALQVPSTTTLGQWCSDNEIRLQVADVRIGASQTILSQADVEWLVGATVRDDRGRRVLSRDQDQVKDLTDAEMLRRDFMESEWQRRAEVIPLSSADQIIRSLCEAEGERSATFTEKTLAFIKQRMRVWLQSQPVPIEKLTALKPRLVETNVVIPKEDLAIFREVYQSTDLWAQHGQRAGIEPVMIDQLRGFFGRFQGEPMRVYWRSVTMGWIATVEFVHDGALVGSHSLTFRFIPRRSDTILPSESMEEAYVPLSNYLAAYSLSSRTNQDAIDTLNWPGWVSGILSQATKRPVVGWFPEEVAGEIFANSISTRQKTIKAEVVLDSVEKWCEVSVSEDRLLLRPKWILATASTQIDPANYELLARSLEDQTGLSPQILGRITLDSDWLGQMHPSEVFLGRLLPSEVVDFRPDWWLTAAATVAGLGHEQVFFQNLPSSVRDRLTLEAPWVRFYMLANFGPVPERPEMRERVIESSSYVLTTSRERIWELEDSRTWGLGVPQLPGLIYSEGMVNYLRSRYEGHIGGPKAYPGLMVIKTLVIRTPHGDLTGAYECDWQFERTGEIEPLVGRPAR